MPRGSSSRGSGSSRSGSGRGGSSNRSSAPKGQIRGGKKVTYSVKDQSGKTRYIGSTNNPSRRADEHRESGKMQPGDRLEVQTRPISPQDAARVEAAKLSSHRQQHGGRNPQRNHTNDGKFHKR